MFVLNWPTIGPYGIPMPIPGPIPPPPGMAVAKFAIWGAPIYGFCGIPGFCMPLPIIGAFIIPPPGKPVMYGFMPLIPPYIIPFGFAVAY